MKSIVSLLKYINIAFLLFIIFGILSFFVSYIFDTKNQAQIESMNNQIKQNNSLIVELQELIKQKEKENEKAMQEAYISNDDIALLIKNVISEITDKEIGLFEVVALNHSSDKSYINLYKTDLSIQYHKNPLFEFYDIYNDIQNELKTRINLIHSKNQDIEIKIANLQFNENDSILYMSFFTRKNVYSKTVN